MPRGRTTGKASGKPARQLLFSEALHQQKHSPVVDPLPPAYQHDRGYVRCLNGSNTAGDSGGGPQTGRYGQCHGGANGRDKIYAPRNSRLPVANLRAGPTSDDSGSPSYLLDQQRPGTPAPSQQANRSRGQSRRNNIRLLGITEGTEGADIPSYLRYMLPKLTDTTIDPPLEFQRAHKLGPKRQDGKGHPRPIIACMLRHGQARQLLQTARTQGPLRLGTLEIRLSADFSRETAERRRAFLSLRPHLRHLNVKFGLFEPTRMWITKNGESRTFNDPEDLRMFLEGLHDTSQTMETMAQSSPPPRTHRAKPWGLASQKLY
ncbi:hypothetical protein NDU88_005480 [Pleurodeles waltl]|uniref:Uncharacterized protein n=1 Tax=Pleurodeles waltl TaxID=8319 RepID=A0AAV7UM01_PLEWA|nr:hypothetical protein NDU88_005480 [Pleurodeles waltl]